jgi:hypothetical protein
MARPSKLTGEARLTICDAILVGRVLARSQLRQLVAVGVGDEHVPDAAGQHDNARLVRAVGQVVERVGQLAYRGQGDEIARRLRERQSRDAAVGLKRPARHPAIVTILANEIYAGVDA